MANSMGILGYDYVEFYVGSAKPVAYWYAKALGMQISGYMGAETGVRDRVSYYLTQNDLKIVVTTALRPSTAEVQSFLAQHGDGVKRWAVQVADVPQTFAKALRQGAIPITLPRKLADADGEIEEAAIRLYDDCELVFINHQHYDGIFKPGYVPFQSDLQLQSEDPGLLKIDHIVGNVRINEMDRWAAYFKEVLDFEATTIFGPGDIRTQYSALLSKVMCSKDNLIKNPINEPYPGLKVSQIEEYINEYHGAGIQHIAISSDDIIASVRALRANGIQFLEIPDTYYDRLAKRNAALPEADRISEDLTELRELGILCDFEQQGYLLQLFTQPVQDRPTFFFEIIQRRNGARGFGQGNFQALFEAIERAQARRGNLERKT